MKYRQAFEDYVTRHNYKDVKALVAFSGKVKIDDTEYTEPSMNGFAEDKLPKVFDGDEYNVLLVANKYQVGFDQPKLCAMYVLKKLRGVNAVQTLSRLNRVCPPFDKKVVVMDFVNHAEEMEDAFAPFYTTTVLSNTATIAQLRELENKIDGYNVLDDRDVETVASIVYNPKGKRTTAKEDRLVYQCIQRAVNVLKNQFNEDHQRAFTKNCRGFVRLYEFLSMASSFGDPELHKKYVFVNLLLTYLVVGNSGGISLKDKIQATNFWQESQGDKGNKQRHASAPNVKLSGADVGLTVDEVKHLSEIIDEVNSRAGKGYDSSAMTKVMLQIKDLLLHSDKLKTSAKNNTEQDFEFSFYDNTDDALIEGLSQNQDFFSLLLSNDDIKHRVLGVFLHEVYKELREQP
ncbi:MAG: UvrB domain 3-containing protein [Gemmiger formicilis]|uniref:type I restriction enzyme subunit R domain-containing protein n=1 Tax=Gemmiger formicilis TaxID=745368 RepID=UPI0039943EA0